MKYICSLLAATLALASCGPKKVEPKIAYKSKIYTEQKLIDFVNGNTSWDDSLKFESVTDSFKIAVVTWSKEVRFLEGLKFTCTDIRDTTIGPMAFRLATFDLKKQEQPDSGSVYNQIKLRVNGIFQTPDLAAGLTKDKTYALKAAPYKQVKRETINYDNKTQPVTYNLGTHLDQIYTITPLD